MTANLGSTTQRNIPDVALTAENVYVKYNNGGTGTFGGTSCAAPLWAGFMALVNQQAATNGQSPIGFVNPTLYSIGKGASYTANFHDTTTGNNFRTGSTTKFPAVTGYDLCTGWGSPNSSTLIATLTMPITPTISGFTPAGGSAGTAVTITGTNFSGATGVTFNNTSAVFTADSPTQITATAPAGVTTGPIKVTTSGGSVTSAANFTVFSFSPSYGLTGTNVTLAGLGFTGASGVSFNGIAAVFTVNSDTQITATVPSNATTGPISVSTPAGTFTSGSSFTALSVNGAPTISSFTPSNAAVGAGVTITGANFVNVTSVSFNGVLATFTVNSPAQITATVPVPMGSVTGFITVTTGYGTGTSAMAFTTLATLATFNSAGDVPVTASSFTATGTTVYFTLNFAPPTGSTLTVVSNTGAGFIGGTFGNLTQGQAVALTYNGVTYHFVANYFGGTGNDLVLQWANTKPLGWGADNTGQLGNSSTNNSSVPGAVSTSGVLANKTVIGMAGGQNHTLALCADGTLAAWGANSLGELGNNSFVNSSVPVAVNTGGPLSGKTVIAVAAGIYHSLALCSDGTIASWGYNNYGQLGNNTTNTSSIPVAVNTAGPLFGKTVVAIAAGEYHSLALCSDGTVASWGYNNNGQLGNNSTINSSIPVAVITAGTPLAGKAVTALSAGYLHSLALCSDGTLAAWGHNAYAQLGNNSNVNSSVPVAVSTAGTPLGGKVVTAAVAGAYFNLALCSDGTLTTWGNNYYGQLGDASNTQRMAPVAVHTMDTPLDGMTVTAVAAGGYHAMAVCADGTLAAWGYNYFGQLGNDTFMDSNVPIKVSTAMLAWGERFVLAGAGQSAFHSLGIVAEPSPYPVVKTTPATSVTTTSATLNGTVNPNGFTTAAAFQYGTTASYGTTTAAQGIGSGSSAVNVSVSIGGLSAHTTYHCTATGTNAAGTGIGADLTFTTLNTNPVANADTASNVSGPVTIAVLANDTDADGDTLSITAVTQGASGSVTTDGTTVTYTPGASFTTSDTFNYTISDGFGGSAIGNVTVSAAPILAWRAQKFGTNATNIAISGDTADPNGNGIPNLFEYALNGDPLGGTTGESILPQASASAGNTLQLAFTHWLDRTDITIAVQASDSPEGPWLGLAGSTAGGAFITLATGTTVSETGTGNSRAVIVVDLYQFTDPAHLRRFMRMQVTRP